MSSNKDKLDALQKGREFIRDNADNIRFDPNIPVTVIFPSDWLKDFKQESTKSRDNPDETFVASIFLVKNPNATDPERLRVLRASEKLYSQISEVLGQAADEGFNGPIMMKIVKEVTGGNPYGTWKVHGQQFEETKKQ